MANELPEDQDARDIADQASQQSAWAPSSGNSRTSGGLSGRPRNPTARPAVRTSRSPPGSRLASHRRPTHGIRHQLDQVFTRWADKCSGRPRSRNDRQHDRRDDHADHAGRDNRRAKQLAATERKVSCGPGPRRFGQLRNRALDGAPPAELVSERRDRKGQVIRIGHRGRAQLRATSHRRTKAEQRDDQRRRRHPSEGRCETSSLGRRPFAHRASRPLTPWTRATNTRPIVATTQLLRQTPPQQEHDQGRGVE